MNKHFLAFVVVCMLGSVASAVDFNPRAYECATTNEVFSSVLYRIVRLQKEPENNPKVRYNPISLAVGYTYRTADMHLGAAFNYEHGSRKLSYSSAGGYKVRTDIPGFSVFGGMNLGDGVYINGYSFLGFANYKSRDGWVGNSSLGSGNKTHKTLFALGGEAGKAFDTGFLTVTPHVGLDYAYMPTERYNWSPSGFSDSIESQSYFEIPLGVSLSRNILVGGWNLTPKVDATLVTSLGKMDPYNAHPGIAFRTADAWKVAGISAGRIGGRIGAGVDANLTSSIKVGVGYAFEGRSRYQDHRLNANFALSF